jgi:hypothetical protein
MSANDPWNGYRGAVSLTFDDGTQNQLDKAIPPLDDRGIKAGFYLNPRGENWRENAQPWIAVAKNGHEIGNHTVTHPCPNNLLARHGGHEDMSLDDMESEILEARKRLLHIAPHQKEWTFAYPCYATHVGRGKTRQSFEPLIARHFLAGREGGEYGIANRPAWVDLAAVAGLDTQRMSGFEMIGLVEKLASDGDWVVLVFHEINGAYLSVGAYDYCMLLDYLKRKEKEIWTAPMVEVARRVAAFQAQQAPADPAAHSKARSKA